MKEQYEEQLRLTEEVSDEFCLCSFGVASTRSTREARRTSSESRATRISFAERRCWKQTKKKRAIMLSDTKLS